MINLNGKRQYSDTANIGLEDNLHRKAYKEDYCRVQERMEDEHEEEQYFAECVGTDGAMQRGLSMPNVFQKVQKQPQQKAVSRTRIDGMSLSNRTWTAFEANESR